MKLISAFLRLVRWQNLVFIFLTQLLFYYCVYKPLYKTGFNFTSLFLLSTASVLIAAGGYIINDYFDLNIDQVNKPQKNVINSIISRRWAIVWHLFLSLSGIILTLVAVSFHKWYLVLANMSCVLLLWLYSTSFKKQMLIGNIVISLLTAWTILVLFYWIVPFQSAFGVKGLVAIKFFRISFLYASFAFVISIVREAIKDIEDMEGDRRYGCKTLPIVAGVVTTKVYIAVWLIVLIGSLIVLQLYVLQFRWWLPVIYSCVTIILPLLLLFRRLIQARRTEEFSSLSSFTKWIMLAGILSMIFFPMYF
jgi:4-hydroxybenzoate polyprenyltransferase